MSQKPTPKNLDILIVDDEEDICRLTADILKDEGYATRYVKGSLEALADLAEKQPSLLLLDIWLEGSQLDGLGVLEIVRSKYPDLPVLMISGHANVETAVSSIKMGAYDFIEKPFKEERLVVAVQKAIEFAKLEREKSALQAKVMPDEFVGKSAAISNLAQVIEKYAETRSRIFINGPEGSGKKTFAKYFHNKSDRKSRPYLVFSPASYKPEELEIEIFGKGVGPDSTFTGEAPKQSIFEKAKGGTLVFDEVTALPTDIQSKLLKALANNKYNRVGGLKEYEIDARIISTTSRDMDVEVTSGKFKSDLYSRLNVVNVPMPSLKERRDDIPALAEYFLQYYANATGRAPKRLSDETISVLQSYEWQGNVRQLRVMVEWLSVMSTKPDSDIIEVASLASDIFSAVPAVPGASQVENNVDIMSMPLREARELFERQYLLAQVNRFGGNISKTSSFIGMERSALHRKLKSLNVHDIRKTKGGADDDIENAAEETIAEAV